MCALGSFSPSIPFSLFLDMSVFEFIYLSSLSFVVVFFLVYLYCLSFCQCGNVDDILIFPFSLWVALCRNIVVKIVVIPMFNHYIDHLTSHTNNNQISWLNLLLIWIKINYFLHIYLYKNTYLCLLHIPIGYFDFLVLFLFFLLLYIWLNKVHCILCFVIGFSFVLVF